MASLFLSMDFIVCILWARTAERSCELGEQHFFRANFRKFLQFASVTPPQTGVHWIMACDLGEYEKERTRELVS